MGSDPFMTGVEAKTPTILTSIPVSRGSDPIKSTLCKVEWGAASCVRFVLVAKPLVHWHEVSGAKRTVVLPA